MIRLNGEYEATLDSKGRFLLPSALRRQLPEEQQNEFMVNKGLDDCLVLYPMAVWNETMDKLQRKNQFVQKNREFIRRFTNGAALISLDGNGRVLLPKRLMEKTGLSKDLTLVTSIDKVEIWDRERYEQWLENSQVDMAELAESVMGDHDED